MFRDCDTLLRAASKTSSSVVDVFNAACNAIKAKDEQLYVEILEEKVFEE